MPKQAEQEEIVICKYCNKPEYLRYMRFGAMRWLPGRYMCRDCYKEEWERQNLKPYSENDLDGPRPTMKEYQRQKVVGTSNQNERYF